MHCRGDLSGRQRISFVPWRNLFDALAIDGETLMNAPLTERREALESFYRANADEPLLRLSPATRDATVARGLARRSWRRDRRSGR